MCFYNNILISLLNTEHFILNNMYVFLRKWLINFKQDELREFENSTLFILRNKLGCISNFKTFTQT